MRLPEFLALNLLGDDASHLENLVRVAPLVIVPGADLDEGAVKLDAGLDIEDRRAGIAAEVGGNDSLVGVAEDALELALGSFLHRRADFLVGRFLVELDREVDEGDVGRGNAHGHARELAVELGKNLAHRLRSTRGGRNHVLEDATATAPILLGRTVNRLLRSGCSVNRGHEAALDAELVVENLGDRSEAVRGAGSVGDDVLTCVGLVIHAIDEHRGRVLGRSGHDDLLRTGRDVSASLLVRKEEARGLDNDLSTDVAPSESGRILLSRETDLLAIDDEAVAVDRDVMLEDTVNGVILQHVREVIGFEKIVDTDHFDVVREVFNRRAENHAADTAKAVNANLDSHFYTFFFLDYPFGTLPNGKTSAKYRRNRLKSQEIIRWKNIEYYILFTFVVRVV